MSSHPHSRFHGRAIPRRTFRKNKWRSILSPTLWTDAFAGVLLGPAILFLFNGPMLFSLLFFLASALSTFPLFLRILRWNAWSISVTQGVQEILLDERFIRHRQIHIPVTNFVSFIIEQGWWDQRLDTGTLVVHGMGGPFVLADIEDFQDLRQVLDARCAFVPQRRPARVLTAVRQVRPLTSALFDSLLNSSHRWADALRNLADRIAGVLGVLARLLRQTADRIQRAYVQWQHWQVRSSHAQSRLAVTTPEVTISIFRGEPIYRNLVTPAGCWAFAEEFIILLGNWNPNYCCAADSSRQYYPNGMVRQVVFDYLRLLRQSHVIIPGAGGHERISARIHTVDDIIACTKTLFDA